MPRYRVILDFKNDPGLELLITANSEAEAKQKAIAKAPGYGFKNKVTKTLVIRHHQIEQVAS